ncbi:ATP synthase F1 subunit delta [Acetivibrio cellulolyticus]|uniref:ATP synthase F1 subunit delta n=1 Tax=Acetivibrio cellulolyticus TaxID=35830 RepID=UPI0001E2CC1D|nr:ATP synthase F1 subunit delta [Acetivibrio cellulolyticus]
MPLVESRYAEALIEITQKDGSTDKVLNDFDTLINLINNNSDLSAFLENPQIQVGDKKKLLMDMLEGIDPNILKLIMLLIDKGRIKQIRGIFSEYKRFADERRDVLNLKIISAVKLDELQVDKIIEKYKMIYKKDRVNTDLQIDESLIGGIKVQIEDRVEDFSLKTRLDGLKSLLIQE